MNKSIIISGMTFLIALSSCTSESALMPESDDTVSCFLPEKGNNSEEAKLRLEFYQKEGCFLLFNDTIRHDLLGVGSDGKEYFKTETIDIGYSVGDNYEQSGSYKYEYFTTIEEKRAAEAFLRNEILQHLQAKSLRPFSWLAVKKVIYTAFGQDTEKTSVKGERCIAVSLGDISASGLDKVQLSRRIMVSMLGDLMLANEKALTGFTDISAQFYDMLFDSDRVEEHEWAKIREKGFIKRAVNDRSGNILWGWYPTKEQDVNAFVELTLSYTEQEVSTQYAAYPIIIQKYREMKKLLGNIGYKF